MRRRIELVFVLFFFSGLAGLIYESVWSHYVKLFLGHAAYAQTLVLVVFIGGLAVGSWLCSRRAERIRNPLRMYALVEGAIGVLALVFHWTFVHAIDWGYAWLLPTTCEQASTFCASQWILAAVMLAPQSILLGATFPLVSSAVLRISGEQPGHDIATLYFLNSLGAVLGVLASAFLLIPSVGLPGTLMTAGTANVAIAILAYLLSKTAPAALAVPRVAVSDSFDAASEKRMVALLLATALFTGLSSFIYEISWIRMLSLVLGASTHSFELMLASFILGLALGGLWIRNRVDIGGDAVRLLAYVQLSMGVFALATLPIYNASFDLMAWLLSAVTRNDSGFVLFNLASTFISLIVMLPATFCAGMTLPLITYRLLRSRSGERALGTVYAVNTLGSILGVMVAVHLLMGWVGVGGALVVGAAIDVLLGVVLLAKWGAGRRMPRISFQGVAAVVALVLLGSVVGTDPRRSSSGVFRTGSARISPDTQVLFHRDGKTATVDVVGDKNSVSIRTNGKPDAALSRLEVPNGDEYTMALLAVLPLGHNPKARSAAVIGFGSGTTTSLLLSSERLERVDTVEIEPSMVEGARFFGKQVEPAYNDPRSHIVIDDAKSYFARGHNRYDIIVSEPSNPWVSGVASLFTEEFYRRLAQYMNDGAVLSQWLHTYEMDGPTFASILAALEKTFPEFLIYTPNDGDVVLIARKGGHPGQFDASVLALPKLQPVLRKLSMTEREPIARRLIGSSATMTAHFHTYRMPANSDYFPVVDQRASKTRFTSVRVEDLGSLQVSGIPMLEMLDGSYGASTVSRDVVPVVGSDAGSLDAWRIYESLLDKHVPRRFDLVDQSNQIAARLVKLWTTNCSSEWTFTDLRPTLVLVAQVINPNLPPDSASAIWKSLSDSRCGKALDAEDRRWVELMGAVGRRDGARMAAVGGAILGSSKERDASLEYAFLATMTGLVCSGRAPEARSLLARIPQGWVRLGQKMSEIRYLDAILSDPRASAAAARCR